VIYIKLSKRSEYAILALIFLSKNYNKELCTISKISENAKIPRKYLEQILMQLKRARYLKSVRGRDGGYSLAKPPNEISLAEIIRMIDGPLAPVNSASKHFYNTTPIEQNKKLLQLFIEIRNIISEKMEKTTIKDVT
jgi:Rrf2 family protein